MTNQPSNSSSPHHRPTNVGHLGTRPAYISTVHGPSFLRWAGSKRKSLAQLATIYSPSHEHYVEPFAGSAALLFYLRPKCGTLGDLNGHLINALREVRDRPRQIHDQLVAMRRDADTYYNVRTHFNTLEPQGPLAAVLFVYLNRNCFNGLWRTNQLGHYNVPYGGAEMGRNPPFELFQSCSEALQTIKLRHQDFRRTIEEAGASSFIYADPPYFTKSERTFIEYGRRSFGQDDLNDLVDALKQASERGAFVAMTYNEAMPLPTIPSKWTRTRVEVTRNVGGFKGARKRQCEILYSNQ